MKRKWKLLTGAVLVLSATWLGVHLRAEEIKRLRAQEVKKSPTILPVADPISANTFNRPKPKVVREVRFEQAEADAFPTGEETLKDRFLKLATNYAESGDDTELQRMADDLQKKIAERDAREKVQEIEHLLKHVLKQYPETEGAKRAKAMLDAGASASAPVPTPASEKK